MAKFLQLAVFLTCAILCGHTISTIVALSSPGRSDFFAEMKEYLLAIDKIVKYFSSNSKYLTLDALYTLRMTKAHFRFIRHVIANARENGMNLPENFGTALSVLDGKVNHTFSTGFKAIKYSRKLETVEYFRRMGFILQMNMHAYSMVSTPNMLLSTPVEERQKVNELRHGPEFNEVSSDRCMTEMYGTGPSHTKCTLSNMCIDIMVLPGGAQSTGYPLTHQLLFAYLADMLGCKQEFESGLAQLAATEGRDASRVWPSTIRELYDVGCANIYLEIELAMAGNLTSLDPMHQDIVMEQGTLCALFGYPATLRSPWVQKVLPLLTPLGCVDDGRGIAASAGRRRRSTRTLDVTDNGRVVAGGDMDTRADYVGPQTRAEATGRKLLYDVLMTDGCSQHPTGLLLSYLAAKVRYMIEMELGVHRTDLSRLTLVTNKSILAQDAQSLFMKALANVQDTASALLNRIKSFFA